LLEEKAIEFVLWRPLILRWQEPKEGVFPIVAGGLNDPAHTDPRASVDLGLKGWSNVPSEKLRRVAKLAADRTWLPKESIPHTAVAVLRSALEAGKFETDGLPASAPWHTLPSAGIDHLAKLGERIVEASVVLNAGHDFLDAKESWESLVRVSSAFRSAGALHETTENILRLEGLPSIPALLLKGVLNPQDIVEIRSSDATKEFREWLWSRPSPTDAKEIGERYLAAMRPQAKAVDRTWFKTVRVSTVSAATSVAGAAIGGAVAGIPGMVAGGVLSLAAGLADTFGLDRILRGKNPRRFADEEIRPRVAELLAQVPLSARDAVATAPSGQTPTSNAAQQPGGNRRQRRAKAAAERQKDKMRQKTTGERDGRE
jgi:hypothetical protein